MPLKPYFLLTQKHIVIAKRPGYLEIETGSGRTLILVPFIYVFLFQEEWLRLVGILGCVVISTYSARWIFDRVNNRIISQGRILALRYENISQDFGSLVELAVERKGGPQGIGTVFTLQGRFVDKSIARIAVRSNLPPILDIIHEVRTYLPSIAVSLPA